MIDIKSVSNHITGQFVHRMRMQQLIEETYGSIAPEIMMNILSDHDNSQSSICSLLQREFSAKMNM